MPEIDDGLDEVWDGAEMLEQNFAGDRELFQEVSSTFIANVPAYHSQVEEFLKDNKWFEAAEVLHTVRGSISIFGFPKIRDRLFEIETQLRLGEPKTNADKISQIVRSYLLHVESALIDTGFVANSNNPSPSL